LHEQAKWKEIDEVVPVYLVNMALLGCFDEIGGVLDQFDGSADPTVEDPSGSRSIVDSRTFAEH
jgi:hypothetical protein